MACLDEKYTEYVFTYINAVRMTVCDNTLTTIQSEHYQNVLDFYLQFKIVNNENRLVAKSLHTYLETHTPDPDNRYATSLCF